MKVKDLLTLLPDGQYVEFNYIDDDGYITGYSIPMYKHVDKHLTDINVHPFLDSEIEEIHSNIEMDGYDAGVDYLVVVLKREEK